MDVEPRISFKSYFGAAFLLLAILIGSSQALANNKDLTDDGQGAISILPYLTVMVDATSKLTIADVVVSRQQEHFLPLYKQSLKVNRATYWLRFMLPLINENEERSNYLLDLGQNIPGIPTVFITKNDIKYQKLEWQQYDSSNNSIFMLPKGQAGISIVYIKLEGPPGLWFDPVLRTAYNAATTYDHMARYALLVILTLMTLFCLIRWITERSEWWFWTSLYLGAVLTKAYVGIPATAQGIVEPAEIVKAVLPGIALIILVHIARHLMKSESHISNTFDKQYLFLTIPGVIIAFLPLIPDFSWTARYIELWPLAILLLIPTTLGAWLSGIYGSRRFLLGCLIPPIFTSFAILGIGSGISSDILATVPLWGVALGTLVIMAIGSRTQLLSTDLAANDVEREDAATAAILDPALRIVNPNDVDGNAPATAEASQTKLANGSNDACISNDKEALALAKRLSVPLDTLSMEVLALSKCSLPAVAKEHSQRINELVNLLTEAVKDPFDDTNDYKNSDISLNDSSSFDLQQIMREAHDSVANLADQKNIGLSWFMPPLLGHKYVGKGQSLLHCLRLLLNNAVRATNHGSVKMSVRRVPESTDTGHLLFSVTDTGLGMPPYRSSASLANVWELVATHKGFFGIECSPDGVYISFTLRLQLLAGEQTAEMDEYGDVQGDNIKSDYAHEANDLAENNIANEQGNTALIVDEFNCPQESRKEPSIIIVDYSLSARQLLTFFLEGLPVYTAEATTPAECVELHLSKQALLIVFDDDLSEDETFSAITKIRIFEMQNKLPSSLILALTKDRSRWVELQQGGFTHALEKPITRLAFRNTIQDLLYELVGLFPAQGMQDKQQEFNENEQGDALNYENTYVAGATATSEKGFSRVHSLDDFLSSNTKASQLADSDAAYELEADFSPEISAYTPDYDFFEEKDSIKIVTENEQNLTNDYEVKNLDQALENDLILPDPANVVQAIIEHNSLGLKIDEAITQLNDAKLLNDEIDSSLEKIEDSNINSENGDNFDIIMSDALNYAENTIDHTPAADIIEDNPRVDAEQKENIIDDAAQDFDITESIRQFDGSSIDTENNIIQENDKVHTAQELSNDYSADSVLDKKDKEINDLESAILDDEIESNLNLSEAEQMQNEDSVEDLLQQNSELKDLITADEFEFFDAAIAIQVEKQGNEQEKESRLPVDMDIIHPNGEEVSLNPLIEENKSNMENQARVHALATPVEATQKRPSLIPQSSLLLNYIVEDQAAQNEASAAPMPNVENDMHKLAAFDNNNESQVGKQVIIEVEAENEKPEPSIDNSLLSMHSEAIEPETQNKHVQNDFSLNKLELNHTVNIVENMQSKNSLHINIDPIDTAVDNNINSNDFILKNDNYAHNDIINQNETELTATENSIENIDNSFNNLSGINKDVAPEDLPKEAELAPESATAKKSGTAFSRLMASSNEKMDSPIPILLDELDESINYANSGFKHNDALAIADAAAYIAKRTEACGLRSLSRMALCVEGAAKVKDFAALTNLLPELETAIKRNRSSLQLQL